MGNLLDNNEYRKALNKKNIIKIIVGFLLLILAVSEIVVTTVVLKNDWMANLWDLLTLAMIITGVTIILLGIMDYKGNGYLRNLPYGFDYEVEWELYKKIGEKKKGKFIYYEKFSSWKSYIEQAYADRKNNVDFYRFLNRKHRAKIKGKELLIKWLIPINGIVITEFFNSITIITEIELIIFSMVLVMFLVICLTMIILGINAERYFLEDFMLLVVPEFYNDVIQDNKKKNI